MILIVRNCVATTSVAAASAIACFSCVCSTAVVTALAAVLVAVVSSDSSASSDCSSNTVLPYIEHCRSLQCSTNCTTALQDITRDHSRLQ
eukprot:17061-Heterococcus_DN1.PRE.2